jgi:hypothetical protein
MAQSIKVPPFEIVRMEDASHDSAKRLRVYLAVRPENAEHLTEIAVKVISDHAANNDVVIMFFYYSAAAAGKTQAEARAQYVRNGLRRGFVPTPLKSERSVHRFKLPRGVVTVETAREATA